jgi:hypothetical protein
MKRSSAFLPIIFALAALIVSQQQGNSATVGYVNVVFLPGYNPVNNPLKNQNKCPFKPKHL